MNDLFVIWTVGWWSMVMFELSACDMKASLECCRRLATLLQPCTWARERSPAVPPPPPLQYRHQARRLPFRRCFRYLWCRMLCHTRWLRPTRWRISRDHRSRWSRCSRETNSSSDRCCLQPDNNSLRFDYFTFSCAQWHLVCCHVVKKLLTHHLLWTFITLWRPLLPCGYSYKASCARPG